jgi:hypothetical protein
MGKSQKGPKFVTNTGSQAYNTWFPFLSVHMAEEGTSRVRGRFRRELAVCCAVDGAQRRFSR